MGDSHDERRSQRYAPERDRYSDDVGNWGDASSVYGEDQMAHDFRAARGGGYGAGERNVPRYGPGRSHEEPGWGGRSYGYGLEEAGYGGYGNHGGIGGTRAYGGNPDRTNARHLQERGRQEERHHDPDYDQWRREQMKALDDDYDAFRRERYQKFSDEFTTWRSSRQSGTEGGITAAGSSKASLSPGGKSNDK